ncbi:hypothetical protein ACFVGY_07930 [Streptomyces sp. NPDC127106]|uniref:hypothetical protein n=1 Tax=Streptomyces sp. NPDC127106 TaxID=3345360 RepID=UPI0036291DCE
MSPSGTAGAGTPGCPYGRIRAGTGGCVVVLARFERALPDADRERSAASGQARLRAIADAVPGPGDARRR